MLKPRINGFTLEGQHAENTLMNTPKGLALDEALQRFNSKGELA